MAEKILIILVIYAEILTYRPLPIVSAQARSCNLSFSLATSGIKEKTDATNHISPVNSQHYGGHLAKALADVQDRIDTIDQTGLYFLLDITASSRRIPPNALSPSPLDLLGSPPQYRGQLVEYNVILNPQPKEVKLSRKTLLTGQVYYIYGQIPLDKHRRAPLIILLKDRQKEHLVRHMKLLGRFYMILREETTGSRQVPAGTVLDYIVIVAQKLEPIPGNSSLQNRNTSWYHIGLSIPVLIILWIFLRKKNTRKGNKFREKT